jgi:hypothetical protein
MDPLELDSDILVPLSSDNPPPSDTVPDPLLTWTTPPLLPVPDEKVKAPPSRNEEPTESAMLPDKEPESPVESVRDPAPTPP